MFGFFKKKGEEPEETAREQMVDKLDETARGTGGLGSTGK